MNLKEIMDNILSMSIFCLWSMLCFISGIVLSLITKNLLNKKGPVVISDIDHLDEVMAGRIPTVYENRQ